MHMTCPPPCGHEFCWVCLDPWNDHQGCKGFQQEEEEDSDGGSRVVVEQRRRHAEMSLDRYFYHYERWVANYTSLEKARQDMDELERSELKRIAAVVGVEGSLPRRTSRSPTGDRFSSGRMLMGTTSTWCATP